ncbi:SUMF1/EgtB/PvdO family nonheme iron enzyme [Streptomyces sp. NPDC008122]|uniref:SUMF1/EgtB/PvdO family nonheme iron enzyme n=1 Tax=Streptomyces sp. NPDC008122 TaxID=3364810 RepID=UPI0036EB56A6
MRRRAREGKAGRSPVRRSRRTGRRSNRCGRAKGCSTAYRSLPRPSLLGAPPRREPRPAGHHHVRGREVGPRRVPAVGTVQQAVSRDDAAACCAGSGRRLPTEAEWEYAGGGAEGRRFS